MVVKRYTVKVLGPQCGDPPSLIGYLQDRFRVSSVRTEINPPDCVDKVVVQINPSTEIVVSAVVPAVLHKEQTYRLHLRDVDGIVYILNGSRALEFYNRDDFAIFAQVYRTTGCSVPIVTLLNDFWAGRCAPGLFSPSEVQPYVLEHSPLFKTVLANHTEDVGTEALECLIGLIEKAQQG